MNNEKGKKPTVEIFTDNRIKIFLLSTGYTIIIVGIIAVSGYYLDHYFETWPTIFIASLIVGYPLSQFLIYQKFRSFAKNKLKENQ